MLGWSLSMCIEASKSQFVPAGLVVASLNMLVQICFSVVFGAKNTTKIRGYRGE